jgi:hypothetical protein
VIIAIVVILLAAVRFLSREQSAATKPERDTQAATDATAPQPANRDPRDAPIERWLVFFPDLLDYLQYQAEGNKEKAALAMLSLPPAETTVKLSKRLDAALALYGIEPLKELADQLKTLPPGPERSAKIDTRMTLLSVRAINHGANTVLKKIEQGEKPTERDLWVLEAAAGVLRDFEDK